MKFRDSIDSYMVDQRSAGRISSDASETVYRLRLNQLAEDVQNRDPRYVGREDVKKCLARWPHPNTQLHSRSIFVAFFDWLLEEGYRKDNPARQTRRPRKREPQVYRLTQQETLAMLGAPKTKREQRAIFLGFCAGLRNSELRGMQGRHFQRPGWIWVSPDIAKGGHYRQVPVIDELVPVVEDILETVALDNFVIPGQRFNPRTQVVYEVPEKKANSQALVDIVVRVAERAGIAGPVRPHAMRRAYADHISRFAGVRAAQELLGHARIATTEGYLSRPTMDDLSAAIQGFGFGLDANTGSRGAPQPFSARTTARLPVNTASSDVPSQSHFVELLSSLWASPLLRRAAREMAL